VAYRDASAKAKAERFQVSQGRATSDLKYARNPETSGAFDPEESSIEETIVRSLGTAKHHFDATK
jgi:hypothetical protein